MKLDLKKKIDADIIVESCVVNPVSNPNSNKDYICDYIFSNECQRRVTDTVDFDYCSGCAHYSERYLGTVPNANPTENITNGYYNPSNTSITQYVIPTDTYNGTLQNYNQPNYNQPNYSQHPNVITQQSYKTDYEHAYEYWNGTPLHEYPISPDRIRAIEGLCLGRDGSLCGECCLPECVWVNHPSHSLELQRRNRLNSSYFYRNVYYNKHDRCYHWCDEEISHGCCN